VRICHLSQGEPTDPGGAVSHGDGLHGNSIERLDTAARKGKQS
jgi:hypothetical protein